ncbi:hypothetical protein Q8G38_15895 [Halomonas venusta]|uniref:hypothetical protein n=1 Tax=Vreelandella venusta TaxID=44935 RepID=UPI00295E5A0A|nr:hypothetical protein [Halomonas venusta]MDW0360795.1 hypothetical protein [Halomonas venusta]
MEMKENSDVIDRLHIKLPGKIYGKEARLIARAAIDKGFDIQILNPKIFTVSSSIKKEIFELNMAGSIGHVAKTITWDKGLTKTLLQQSGIKSPDGVTFDAREEKNAAISFFQQSQYKSFVLKPLNGILGSNVFLDINNIDDMLEKCDLISKRYKVAMIEEQVYGKECRYFVVGDDVKGVIERIPGNVIGDGISTIRKLIENKNNARKRHLSLKQIKIDDETRALLKEQHFSLDYVPEEKEYVKLKRVSNISQGGDSIDITDDVHDDIKKIAVDAVKAIPTLSYAGLDIIAEDHCAPAKGQQVNVLEINWNPMVRMHHAPAYGKPRDIAGDIIDLIFSK